ncbi:MAG: DegT/DnrJ/EryC1/StrS family aminotransferase, partial [Dehalococcoidia bacterium]|nr:DegT/DnrJ/EryC1/StrS family aminotransferase [Dehalococcoidia bacterium]
GAGDEVITVPNTAVATFCAITFAGATPVFVDVDAETANLDPANVEGKITGRTRAILPVHLYGHPAEMDPLMATAKSYGLSVIEDACQAHGSEYRGKKVGTIGDAGCFSFYPSKNLGAYGDGGMVTTNDPLIAERLRLLRQYGWRRRDYSEVKGFNSRLDEMQAAILRVKLRRLDGWNEARRKKSTVYDELLAGAGVELSIERTGCKTNRHLYVIKTNRRNALHRYLTDRGIGCGVHYPTPIYLQEAYLDLGVPAGACPVAEDLAGRILSLPLYPELGEEQVREVAEAIRSFA